MWNSDKGKHLIKLRRLLFNILTQGAQVVPSRSTSETNVIKRVEKIADISSDETKKSSWRVRRQRLTASPKGSVR
jgi:hypothetical protein